MDFSIFCTVVNRRKRFTHTLQKCPPHLIKLPSENENITFHTFIMHSLNITHCIKLNDRPDGIIHQIEVWWVRWPHVCHSATCVWDQSSWHRWAVTASTACVARLEVVADWWCKCACGLVFVSVTDILNILCDVNLFSLYLMNFIF